MTYPPATPFMQLAFADREQVFVTALDLYYTLRQAGRTYRRAEVGKLARLQLYVCGRAGAELEAWMLGEKEG